MGKIKHHAIVVTSWKEEHIKEAQQKAKEIFSKHFEDDPKKPSHYDIWIVGDIVEGIANGQYSFFIPPDGSTEGWDESDRCDKARVEFLNWLMQSNLFCDYVEICFGGDSDVEYVSRSGKKDLKSKWKKKSQS